MQSCDEFLWQLSYFSWFVLPRKRNISQSWTPWFGGMLLLLKSNASTICFRRNIKQLTTHSDETHKVIKAYVYWTVHHLDSWIKRDQLDVTCFIISLFNAQHVSDVNTSILRSLRLICWVISWVVLFWFDVCWCYVVVWWWCGVRMQTEACIRTPHHHQTTT